MMTDLYESAHKRFKDDYEMTSKRLYSVMCETLNLQVTRQRTSASVVNLMIIQKGSELHCFGKRVYNRKREKPKTWSDFCELKVGSGQQWECSPKLDRVSTVSKDIFLFQAL